MVGKLMRVVNPASFIKTLGRIRACYRLRKQLREPDLRPWEFLVQMLCSAYLSWRWIGGTAGRFKFWSLRYWEWLAEYSSLSELRVRAALADDRALEEWRRLNPQPPQPSGPPAIDDAQEFGRIG